MDKLKEDGLKKEFEEKFCVTGIEKDRMFWDNPYPNPNIIWAWFSEKLNAERENALSEYLKCKDEIEIVNILYVNALRGLSQENSLTLSKHLSESNGYTKLIRKQAFDEMIGIGIKREDEIKGDIYINESNRTARLKELSVMFYKLQTERDKK